MHAIVSQELMLMPRKSRSRTDGYAISAMVSKDIRLEL